MANEQTNTQIQKHSANGQISLTEDRSRFLIIGALVNKIRVAQGRNILAPADLMPVASFWNEQLKRHGIPDDLLDELINRAIDHRTRFLKDGQRAPDFSVELIIAMFAAFKADNPPMSDFEFQRLVETYNGRA